MAALAEKMGMSEPGINSWTNGNRNINLADFLRLCEAAGLDPAVVLFSETVDPRFLYIGEAWVKANDMQKGAFLTVAKGVLAEQRDAEGKGANSG